MSTVTVGASVYFYFSKYLRSHRPFTIKLGVVGLVAAGLALAYGLKNLEVDHLPGQEATRGNLAFLGWLLAGVPLYLHWRKGKSEFQGDEEFVRSVAAKQRREYDEQLLREKEAYLSSEKDWSVRTACEYSGDKAELMLDGAKANIRLVSYDDESEFEVLSDRSIPIGDIFSVEVKRPEEIETYYRTEYVPIVSTKNKSPIVRSLVGGAVLGPVGAIVGGISGARTEINAKVEERAVADERIRAGKPLLVVGIRDFEDPVITLSFYSERDLEQWQYRLSGMIAKSSQS